MLKIISKDNPQIKNIIKLRDANKRKKQDLIIIEGEREINYAIEGGLQIVNFFLGENTQKDSYGLIEKLPPEIKIELGADVFKKISQREHPDGYLALAKPRELRLSDIKISKNAKVVILEQIEKPGNLGAIMRTTDAAGFDAVILTESRIDIYNPNAIRASQGTIFTNQIATCSNEECLGWLNEKKIISFGAALVAKKFHTEADFNRSCALIFGAEDKGLTDFWLKNCNELIKIPMKGKIDSLNLSVSAGIMIYETIRQN